MVEVSKDEVELASEAYAKATNYYAGFHRGLSSPSADNIRRGVRAALEAVSFATLQAERDRYRVAIESALQCTPEIMVDTTVEDEDGPRFFVQYDCGDPWELLRTALSDTPTVQS